MQNYGKIVYVIQRNICLCGKEQIERKCQDIVQGFWHFPEDNFCKMRQWNILEHMFIICNIRSDKTFT